MIVAQSQQKLLLAGLLGVLALPVQAQLPPPANGSVKVEEPSPTPKTSEPAPQPGAVPYLPPAADSDQESTPDPTPTPQTPTSPPKTYSPPKPPPAKPAAPKPLTVGGVSIRGLNDVAAIKKLRAAHAPKLRVTVELWDGKEAHRLRRDTLGASIPYYKLLAQARRQSKIGGDVPLRFEVNLQRAERAMKSLAARINHAPATASIDADAGGKVVFVGGEGAVLATVGSAQRVQAALESEPPQSYVELVVVRQPGTSTLRRFKYLLSEYSTPYDANLRGRTTNLKMAARLVDGEIVQPGKVFSTNLAIGPRNAANGWKEAKMFVNGQVVDGVGAGICQCATTLYNVALLANLPILERHQHSFRVKYAPASRDAAIYWGQKDMKFRNTTNGPIYVQTFVKGGRFHARLYGVEPVKTDVEIESRVLSTRKGTSSVAYRVVRSDSGVQRQFLSRDYYKPQR